MDEPYKYFGKSHRKLFHDYSSAATIASECYPGDKDAVWVHIYYDSVCSEDRDVKRLLENLEALSHKKKNPRNKGNVAKRSHEWKDPFPGDLKRWEEIRRIMRRFYSTE
jgi:hypothetical protein